MDGPLLNRKMIFCRTLMYQSIMTSFHSRVFDLFFFKTFACLLNVIEMEREGLHSNNGVLQNQYWTQITYSIPKRSMYMYYYMYSYSSIVCMAHYATFSCTQFICTLVSSNLKNLGFKSGLETAGFISQFIVINLVWGWVDSRVGFEFKLAGFQLGRGKNGLLFYKFIWKF